MREEGAQFATFPLLGGVENLASDGRHHPYKTPTQHASKFLSDWSEASRHIFMLAVIRGQIAVANVDAIAQHWMKVHDVPKEWLSARQARDGDSFHVSVIGKEEIKNLTTAASSTSASSVLSEIVASLQSCPLLADPRAGFSPADLVDVGVGIASNQAVFAVILSPVLQWIRRSVITGYSLLRILFRWCLNPPPLLFLPVRRFGLAPKQFHITLGFNGRDAHDVDKGVNSLLGSSLFVGVEALSPVRDGSRVQMRRVVTATSNFSRDSAHPPREGGEETLAVQYTSSGDFGNGNGSDSDSSDSLRASDANTSIPSLTCVIECACATTFLGQFPFAAAHGQPASACSSASSASSSSSASASSARSLPSQSAPSHGLLRLLALARTLRYQENRLRRKGAQHYRHNTNTSLRLCSCAPPFLPRIFPCPCTRARARVQPEGRVRERCSR